jgi:hypothetical protein
MTMARVPVGLARLLVVGTLGLALVAGTAPPGAFAKGGDHGNAGGNGNGGGDHGNAGGNGNGGGNQGNGKGDGGPAGGGPAGGGPGGHGAQATGGGASATADPSINGNGAGLGDAHGAANGPMLTHAIVALNATYAVPHQPPLAAAHEARMRQMAAYDRMMLAAIQLPGDTPAERAARDRAIAGARLQLAAATGRRLNPLAVERIDAALGLPPTDPQLGVR